MPLTAIFKAVKCQFKIKSYISYFSQNIDCGYTLEPTNEGGTNDSNRKAKNRNWNNQKARITHNLCVRAKLRK